MEVVVADAEDQHGSIRVWNLNASACSSELVPLVLRQDSCRILVEFCPHGVSTNAGDQQGNIGVWDLTASACSCELVPEVGTAMRSLTVALNGSLVVAANNAGTCYVWRMLRGASLATHFEPLHKLRAHAGTAQQRKALQAHWQQLCNCMFKHCRLLQDVEARTSQSMAGRSSMSSMRTEGRLGAVKLRAQTLQICLDPSM